MPADLTLDRGGGERRERDPAARIETVRSLHEPNGTDLNEVVELLTTACVAARYRAYELQMAINQMRIRAHRAHTPVEPIPLTD